MLAKILSAAHFGLKTIPIEVEVNVSLKGFPGFNIIGLPTKSVEEAKERVKTAIVNSGFEFPVAKIIVNLAPADIPKEGSCYDLPIAVGILTALKLIELPKEKSFFYGELSLDGMLRHSKGVFLLALSAQEFKVKNLFVPKLSANEATMINKINVFGVESLKELINHLTKVKTIKKFTRKKAKKDLAKIEAEFDFAEIFGQEQAKRALEIAATGGHNLFMQGPPGSGKTMLARALPGILPPLNLKESLEVTKIYSVTGNIPPGGSLVYLRPFRMVHHSASRIGLIGGGSLPRPGEISLAHYGVLFLDELPEFSRYTLEALRQPMEDGLVNISRVSGSFKFPAQFMLVAAANPCPCGFLGDTKKECKCTPRQIMRYQAKLSGPLMDRIDLQINVPIVEIEKLSKGFTKTQSMLEKSSTIRQRVCRARQIQNRRFRNLTIQTNCQMKNKEIKKFCSLTSQALLLLKQAVSAYRLSARTYFRLIKVSRTIADLANREEITQDHVAEALQYRIREEKD